MRTPSLGSVRLGALSFALALVATPASPRRVLVAPEPRREVGRFGPLGDVRGDAWAGFTNVDAWESGLCLVDANDDRDDDVAGIARVHDARRVAVVDGQSGEIVWSKPIAETYRVLCGGARAVLVARADAGLVALAAKSGDERWQTTLPDAAIHASPGEGCARVRLATGADEGIDLATGRSTSCAIPGEVSPSRGAPRRWTAREDGAEVVLTASEIGTSALTLEATRPGAAMWREDLPLVVPPSSEPFLAVRAGVVIVAAMRDGASDELVWLRRDLATGEAQAEHTEERRGEAHGFRAVLGSTRVLAAWADGLAAYDPASGERLFRVGAR